MVSQSTCLQSSFPYKLSQFCNWIHIHTHCNCDMWNAALIYFICAPQTVPNHFINKFLSSSMLNKTNCYWHDQKSLLSWTKATLDCKILYRISLHEIPILIMCYYCVHSIWFVVISVATTKTCPERFVWCSTSTEQASAFTFLCWQHQLLAVSVINGWGLCFVLLHSAKGISSSPVQKQGLNIKRKKAVPGHIPPTLCGCLHGQSAALPILIILAQVLW